MHFLMRYQNACYGCENAENQTWSPFFMTDESVGGSVNVIDIYEFVFIFQRAKISKSADSLCNGLL